MDLGIKGKIALVTGGSRGLGRQSSLSLAKEGVHVAICARGKDAISDVVEEVKQYGVNGFGIVADMTSSDSIKELFDTVSRKFGSISILVNNVGGRLGGKDLEDTSDEEFRQTVELNLEEAYRGGQKRFSIRSGPTIPPRTIDVRIPPGVAQGSKIRVAGEGLPTPTGGRAGDLYLTVKLRPHAVFECKGRDVHMSFSLPIPTAVLGGEVAIRTLSEDSVRLRIPRGTQFGQVFRV